MVESLVFQKLTACQSTSDRHHSTRARRAVNFIRESGTRGGTHPSRAHGAACLFRVFWTSALQPTSSALFDTSGVDACLVLMSWYPNVGIFQSPAHRVGLTMLLKHACWTIFSLLLSQSSFIKTIAYHARGKSYWSDWSPSDVTSPEYRWLIESWLTVASMTWGSEKFRKSIDFHDARDPVTDDDQHD